jgi:peptidoglycan-associated lipoprotein
MFKLHTLSLLAAGALLLAGCNSVPLEEKKIEERVVTPTPTPTPKRDDNRIVEPVKAVVDPLDDPQGVLAKRSVYFDYDAYTVKDEYKGVVQNHAQFLANNKGRKITIQGNTDERGGSEYNLALGQKRAEAVRKAMNAVGVPDAQMEAVSFGKEKPKALGSDEAAWAENRRADIFYPKQ